MNSPDAIAGAGCLDPRWALCNSAARISSLVDGVVSGGENGFTRRLRVRQYGGKPVDLGRECLASDRCATVYLKHRKDEIKNHKAKGKKEKKKQEQGKK